MSGSQEATTRITMKKFVCMSLFVAAIMALYSFAPKDKIDETIQEEVGLSLSKISDDKLCKGHVYPLSKPSTWTGFLGGVSAKQKFYWSTFRLLALSPDGNDLAFVTVSLTDADGTLIPDANNQLLFEVTGNGSFKAACNGDATSLEQFTQPTMKLFNGQLVVVLQAAKTKGQMTLRVSDAKNKNLVAETVINVK